jgi:diadenylate cyclase
MSAFPITWQVIADIALLALLVWVLYTMLRGTRAFHMLVGVGVIVALGAFAVRFELPVIGWVASHLAPFLAFALIIIFQGEIRRLLARLGRFVTLSSSAGGTESYEDIVMAANFFAQNRIGALIVIERELGLRTFIESGVPMEAHISFDLLASVFRPSAPLHDGAVIVRRDRIAAAACFLPLSLNPVLSNELGTRHRAAIGITEETDAIAIVVSEETGKISLAISGKIERALTVDELRERLGKLVGRFVPMTTPPTSLDEESEGDPSFRRSDSDA